MRVNLRQNAGSQFAVLSADQCEQIFLAALEVLERVGAQFYEPEALAQLLLRGVGGDEAGQVDVVAASGKKTHEPVDGHRVRHARRPRRSR